MNGTGGIVQIRYWAHRIGARITNAAANEVPGDGRGPAIGKGKRIFGLGAGSKFRQEILGTQHIGGGPHLTKLTRTCQFSNRPNNPYFFKE